VDIGILNYNIALFYEPFLLKMLAGKSTVGLASHWPCVTDNSGITTYTGSRPRTSHLDYAPVEYGHLTLFNCLCAVLQAVSMVAASPVSHEPQSNMAPVKVHQFQLLPWPAAAFMPSAGGDPLGAAPAGTCPMVADYGGVLQADGDAVQSPPFQRLLSSFGGGQLSDDDEDDTVVSVDEANGRALAAAAALQHRAAVDYLRHGGGPPVDGLLTHGGTPGGFATVTAAQHGIIC